MPCIRHMYINYSIFYGNNWQQLGFNRSKSLLLQFIIHEYIVRAVFSYYRRQITMKRLEEEEDAEEQKRNNGFSQ